MQNIKTAEEAAANWLSSFAADVPKAFIETHARTTGDARNFLWHVFSYEKVPCLKGDAARRAFDALEYDEALMFSEGWRKEPYYDLKPTGKIAAGDLDGMDDTYVTAADGSWTYVHTHEDGLCGPYFCRRTP